MIHQDSEKNLRTKHYIAVMEPIATGDEVMKTAIARDHRVIYTPAWMGRTITAKGRGAVYNTKETSCVIKCLNALLI